MIHMSDEKKDLIVGIEDWEELLSSVDPSRKNELKNIFIRAYKTAYKKIMKQKEPKVEPQRARVLYSSKHRGDDEFTTEIVGYFLGEVVALCERIAAGDDYDEKTGFFDREDFGKSSNYLRIKDSMKVLNQEGIIIHPKKITKRLQNIAHKHKDIPGEQKRHILAIAKLLMG